MSWWNDALRLDTPWALLLLLPALWLLWRGRAMPALDQPWLGVVPADGWSRALQAVLRAAAVLAVLATVLALAGPHRPERQVDRIGQGAELVVVFDRSSSMDDRFTRANSGTWTPADSTRESKAAVARRLLMRFARERDHDAFSLVHFAENPIPFLPFTTNTDMVAAAMDAAGVGRGLGNTDIGRGMLAGAAQFDDRPYVGSRAMVLVSDGGARLDDAMRQRLGAALKKHHIGVYWLYLRGSHGRKIVTDGSLSEGEVAAIPEQSLHDFFSKLGGAYKVYQTDQPQALERAITDLGALEQRPIQAREWLPRVDLAGACLGVALVSLLLLLGARAATVKPWAH